MGNEEAITAWNTVLFDKFVRYRSVIAEGGAVHGLRAMDLYPPRRGASMVDIGCGFGDTTNELARRVGPEGRVVGIDAAARFIEAARAEATEPNVTFACMDVEQAVTGGPYDQGFARFGTMFFSQPVIALRNIREALVPGGRFCMVVWRKKEVNEAFYAAESVVRDILGQPPKGDPAATGPFSMGNPDLVSDQMVAAGWHDISFTRNDAPIRAGDTVEQAVEFAMTLGPAGEVIRLAADEGVRRRPDIATRLHTLMTGYARPDGVFAPSTTWIVAATA